MYCLTFIVLVATSGDSSLSGYFCFGVIVAIVVTATLAVRAEQEKIAQMSPEERECYLAQKREEQLTLQWGPINPAMLCPHCQAKGNIRTKHVVQKRGISGGKATAALITGGISVLATGLSRKEGATQAYCASCNNTWVF